MAMHGMFLFIDMLRSCLSFADSTLICCATASGNIPQPFLVMF